MAQQILSLLYLQEMLPAVPTSIYMQKASPDYTHTQRPPPASETPFFSKLMQCRVLINPKSVRSLSLGGVQGCRTPVGAPPCPLQQPPLPSPARRAGCQESLQNGAAN